MKNILFLFLTNLMPCNFIKLVNITNLLKGEEANWFCYHLWAQVSSRSQTAYWLPWQSICLFNISKLKKNYLSFTHIALLLLMAYFNKWLSTLEQTGWLMSVNTLWQNAVINVKENSCWNVHRMHDSTECLPPGCLHH